MNIRLFAIALFLCFGVTANSRNDIRLLEAESFQDKGGWTLCNQYLETMGSPYLMAHGLGKPVSDAVSYVDLPSSGKWHIYVRTFNWTSPWTSEKGPGQFRIKVGGETLETTLGCTGNCWEWQYAGAVKAASGKTEVTLTDLTGFDGRCDAIVFSKKKLNDIDALRSSLTDTTVRDGGSFDFVVCGGGIAGICAAVSAARLGLKTALVHDRAVLGGNNSAEVQGEVQLKVLT